jgi:hypothetical protein
MSSNWAHGLTRWPPYVHESGTCDLSHLYPTRFTLSFSARAGYAARDVEIRVGYSSHVFTTRCGYREQPHAAYSKAHDARVFCTTRYRLSFTLPALVSNLGNRRCYATRHKNHFIVNALEGLPSGMEYWVFFNLRKTNKPDALRLFVESAYPGETTQAPYGRKRESILFRALVSKTLDITRQEP